jgi:hypothetical protein
MGSEEAGFAAFALFNLLFVVLWLVMMGVAVAAAADRFGLSVPFAGVGGAVACCVTLCWHRHDRGQAGDVSTYAATLAAQTASALRVQG